MNIEPENEDEILGTTTLKFHASKTMHYKRLCFTSVRTVGPYKQECLPDMATLCSG